MKQLTSFLFLLLSLSLYSQVDLILQQDKANIKDAQVWSAINFGNDTINYGKSEQLVLNAWTNSSVKDTIRVLIEFDLSPIPRGSNITKAKLSLYNNPDALSHNGQHQNLLGSNEWVISRITQRWNEENVTWINKPTYSTDNQVYVEASTFSNQNFIDIDVSGLVQDMANTPSNSFGFHLMLQDESPYKALVFASSEHPDKSKWPKLEISYTETTGIDNLNPLNQRKLLKVVDLLGRETDATPNKVLIYIYSDGTKEKKMIVE